MWSTIKEVTTTAIEMETKDRSDLIVAQITPPHVQAPLEMFAVSKTEEAEQED